MTDTNPYLTTCSEDEDGNLIFEIPDDLLDVMGWGEGTLLDIQAIGGSIVLREVVAGNDENLGRGAAGE